MNVRVTLIELPSATKLYTLEAICDEHGTLTLRDKSGTQIILVEEYLNFSVDNDGAVT